MELLSGVSFEFVLFVCSETDEQSETAKYKIRTATKALSCNAEYTIVINKLLTFSS
jgi:hypothetical protein